MHLQYLVFWLIVTQFTLQGQHNSSTSLQTHKDLKVAYFASGCFWCVEAVFESVEGVVEAVSGYSGGDEPNPTYREVSYGRTSHAEAVAVYYNPEVRSYEDLVAVYYNSHDPTQVNGQGPDKGRQYRSIAFYQNDHEKAVLFAYKKALNDSGVYQKPIATEIVKFERFYPAEEYHQNYEKLHPNDPYIKAVSIPRINRFKALMPELLKRTFSH